MRASDIVLGGSASLLFKGPWGHGKTLAAASFALDGPVYLAYWDKKGPVELVSYFSRFGQIGDRILNNIEYDVYGAQNANEFLNKLIKLADDCRLFAFINDSVTNMTSGAVNWSLNFRDNKKVKDKLKVLPDWDEYKVETSLATQSLDICRILPCHVIWIAHPVASTRIEGSGSSLKVSKVTKLVSYGSKVGDIVPGNFSEIYHFSKMTQWDQSVGKSSTKYIVDTEAIGDDFAKSNLGLTGQIDHTDQFFYQIWKDKLKLKQEEVTDARLKATEDSKVIDPFTKTPNSVPQWKPNQ